MNWLARYFEFARLGTNWRQEVGAALATFVTMAYIIAVNPAILKEAGVPIEGATAATCISAGFASILMGFVARYPIALAPGMGLNAYFTYVVVKGMHVPWQVALGAVFLSGVLFLILTVTGIRQKIVEAIPPEMHASVAVGIGLFIALLGLRSSGVIAPNTATMVGLGNLRDANTLLSLGSLAVMAILHVRKVPGAILFGIVGSTIFATFAGMLPVTAVHFDFKRLTDTAFALDIPGALRLGVLEIVFVFFFVDLFDNLGTLVAVTKKAGLVDADGRIPRLGRILTVDAISTVFGSLAGTSTVVSYIESTAGVVAGGRSGAVAVIVGLLFLTSIPLAPLVGAIPPAATAPALILVGAMMMSHTREINWEDPAIGISSFLTIISIPLTFSIATGLAFGFIAYVLLMVATGRAGRVHWMLYVMTGLCVLRFSYFGRD